MPSIVTLRFGSEAVELECSSVAFGVTENAMDEGIPPGYVRLNIKECYDPVGVCGIPTIDEGTTLVREEHVAMVQQEA